MFERFFEIRKLFLASIICLFCALPSKAEHIVFITEDLPPLAYKEGQHLKGYNIELLQLVLQKMQMPLVNIDIQPWARSLRNFESNTPTCLFPVALTEDRKQKYRYVETPASFDAVLIAFKKDASLFTTKKAIMNSRISVPHKTGFLAALKAQGFPESSYDYSTTLVSTLGKFIKGRVPLVGGDKINLMSNYAQQGGDPNDLVVVWNIMNAPNGFIFNEAVSEEFIDDFKKQMAELRSSEEHSAIFKKHLKFSKAN